MSSWSDFDSFVVLLNSFKSGAVAATSNVGLDVSDLCFVMFTFNLCVWFKTSHTVFFFCLNKYTYKVFVLENVA